MDTRLFGDLGKSYHDTEWGIPLHDDFKQFEFLSLENLQCGLSWGLMLKKRSIISSCFAEFDYNKVAAFTPDDVTRILTTDGMIRSKPKIEGIITNARCFLAIREEFGSFSDYIWSYSQGKTIVYKGHAEGLIPTKNALSTKISKDLKKRGFKYVGPVVIYSHLQACGIINDHSIDCPLYQQLIHSYPTVFLDPDGEGDVTPYEVPA